MQKKEERGKMQPEYYIEQIKKAAKEGKFEKACFNFTKLYNLYKKEKGDNK